jgi:hypothetical protein
MNRTATAAGPGIGRSLFSQRRTVRMSLSSFAASSACVTPKATRAAANSLAVISAARRDDGAKLGSFGHSALAQDFAGLPGLNHHVSTLGDVTSHIRNAGLLSASHGELKADASRDAGVVHKIGGDGHVFHNPSIGPLALNVNASFQCPTRRAKIEPCISE